MGQLSQRLFTAIERLIRLGWDESKKPFRDTQKKIFNL